MTDINISNKNIYFNNNEKNRRFEIIFSNFSSERQNQLIKIIENVLSNCEEQEDIAKNLCEQCINIFGGGWTVNVGKEDSFNTCTSNYHLAIIIGPYKISLINNIG